MIVQGQPTVEQRVAQMEQANRRLKAEVAQLREQLAASHPEQKPKDCCALGQWQDRQQLPRACAHWTDAGQGPSVRQRRERELAEIDAEEDAGTVAVERFRAAIEGR